MNDLKTMDLLHGEAKLHEPLQYEVIVEVGRRITSRCFECLFPLPDFFVKVSPFAVVHNDLKFASLGFVHVVVADYVRMRQKFENFGLPCARLPILQVHVVDADFFDDPELAGALNLDQVNLAERALPQRLFSLVLLLLPQNRAACWLVEGFLRCVYHLLLLFNRLFELTKPGGNCKYL